MARGKQTSEQVRAAVLAALIAGQGVCEVATQFNLPESTVRSIKSGISDDQFALVRAKKQIDFGELIAGYLEETLITLQAQAKFFRDETWIKQQPASDLAVLHGVQADKTLRILEAIERAHYGRIGDVEASAGSAD